MLVIEVGMIFSAIRAPMIEIFQRFKPLGACEVVDGCRCLACAPSFFACPYRITMLLPPAAIALANALLVGVVVPALIFVALLVWVLSALPLPPPLVFSLPPPLLVRKNPFRLLPPLLVC
jgi:hypothetical protein